MTLEDWQILAQAVQSIITAISIVVAGIWAYRRFIVQQEKYPNINFTADINLIGKQNDEWLVELIALIENKGKAQHKMMNLNFDLNVIYDNENLITSDKWGGQVDFKHQVAKGSFLPGNMTLFFIDPGTTAKYSYISKLPQQTSYAILHCTFNYVGRKDYGHTAEKTIKVANMV
jgi:hypothetical protein